LLDVRRGRGEQLGVQLAFVGTDAMRWVAGAEESGGVEQLAARFGPPAIQSARAGLGDDPVPGLATNHSAQPTDGRGAPPDFFPEFLQRGRELMGGREGGLAPGAEPVVMTGAALGLPGADTGLASVRVRQRRHLREATGS
jgi:hypothetical protein